MSSKFTDMFTPEGVRRRLKQNEHDAQVVRVLGVLCEQLQLQMDDAFMYTLLELVRLNVPVENIVRLLREALRARQKEMNAQLLQDEQPLLLPSGRT